MRFNMKEEELASFERFFENYIEDLQSQNEKMNTGINEVLANTKYHKLQSLIMNLMNQYNDLIEKELLDNTYEKWIASDGSLVKLMRLYRVGSDAEAVCVEVQTHIRDCIFDSLKITVEEVVVDTANPIIKTEDYEAVQNICNTFCNEVEGVYTNYSSQLQSLEEENNIYKCLGSLFVLIQSFLRAFVENMESIFEKEEQVAEAILLQVQKNVEDAVAESLQFVNSDVVPGAVGGGNDSGGNSFGAGGTNPEAEGTDLGVEGMNPETEGTDPEVEGMNPDTEGTNPDEKNVNMQPVPKDGVDSLGVNPNKDNADDNPEETKSNLKRIMDHFKNALDFLNTPEKREGIKNFVKECGNKVKDCLKDGGGFKKVRDAIKPFMKEYGKPIAELLSAVSPILGTVNPVAGKIAKCIPEIIDSIIGDDEDESNLPKVDAGMRLLKALGIDDLPTSEDEILKLVSGDVDDLKREIGESLFGDFDPEIMKLFGVDMDEIYDLFGMKKDSEGDESADTPNDSTIDASIGSESEEDSSVVATNETVTERDANVGSESESVDNSTEGDSESLSTTDEKVVPMTAPPLPEIKPGVRDVKSDGSKEANPVGGRNGMSKETDVPGSIAFTDYGDENRHSNSKPINVKGYDSANTIDKSIDSAFNDVERDDFLKYMQDSQKAAKEDYEAYKKMREYERADEIRHREARNRGRDSESFTPSAWNGENMTKQRQKYSNAIRQACGAIAPAMATEPAMAKAFTKQLPQMLDCMCGNVQSPSDLTRAAMGMDCLGVVGLDQIPSDSAQRQQYISENSGKMCDGLVDKIMSNPDYRDSLGLRPDAIDSPELRKLYAEKTGETPVEYPAKPNPYNYDFDQYNPDELARVKPENNAEQMQKVSDNVSQADFGKVDLSGIEKELSEIKSALSDEKGYVSIPQTSEMGGLIDAIKNAVGSNSNTPILRDNDGRYNKSEISDLVSTLDSGMQKGMPLQSCANDFVKRDMGYPVTNADGTSNVQDLRELIPVLNSGETAFSVENEDINELIRRASSINSVSGSYLIKNRVVSSLLEDVTLFASMVGIGTVFATVGFAPAALLFMGASIAWMIHDEAASAYAQLVVNLGRERTDTLLDHYRMEDGYYRYY